MSALRARKSHLLVAFLVVSCNFSWLRQKGVRSSIDSIESFLSYGLQFNSFLVRFVSDSLSDWGGGMSACCKPPIQLFADAGDGWPHSALRYH